MSSCNNRKGECMKSFIKLNLILMGLLVLTSCNMSRHLEERAAYFNSLEDKSLIVSKENRELKVKLSGLEAEIDTLNNKNHYLKIQVEKLQGKGRSLASIRPVAPGNDLVQFNVYKWKPAQMLKLAQSEFNKKNFEKSAQFFQSFSQNYSENKAYDDKFLFQAGVAAFESGQHYDWSVNHFGKIVDNYPASKFYRGAKLWTAMAYLNTGKEDQFFTRVEEFRKKYRNTPEWDILRKHYEKIIQRHKKN